MSERVSDEQLQKLAEFKATAFRITAMAKELIERRAAETCQCIGAGTCTITWEEPEPQPLSGVELRRAVAEVCGAENIHGSIFVGCYFPETVSFSNFHPDTNPRHLALALMAAPREFRADYVPSLGLDSPYVVRMARSPAAEWGHRIDDPIEICRLIASYGGA